MPIIVWDLIHGWISMALCFIKKCYALYFQTDYFLPIFVWDLIHSIIMYRAVRANQSNYVSYVIVWHQIMTMLYLPLINMAANRWRHWQSEGKEKFKFNVFVIKLISFLCFVSLLINFVICTSKFYYGVKTLISTTKSINLKAHNYLNSMAINYELIIK